MKCLICGGKTLTGAKLCAPCRAALRRARDDTISELLPLPRRRDALAYAHATSVAGPLPSGATVVVTPRRTGRRKSSLLRRVTPAHFRIVALMSFAAAAGFLAFIAIHELQRERSAVTPGEGVATSPAADSHAVVQRVSPSTLLGSAREENPPAPAAESIIDAQPEALPPVTVTGRKIERPARPRTPQGRAPAAVDAGPIAAEPAPVIIRAPAPAVPPAVAAAPDRGTLLVAALTKCAGGDFLSRVVCQHRSRSQYCDGWWGQHPLCPGGIANDHGQ